MGYPPRWLRALLRSAIKSIIPAARTRPETDRLWDEHGRHELRKGLRIDTKSVLHASYRALVPACLSLAGLPDCDSCMHVLKRNAHSEVNPRALSIMS